MMSQTLLSGKGQQQDASCTPGQSHIRANPVISVSGMLMRALSRAVKSRTVVDGVSSTSCMRADQVCAHVVIRIYYS